METLIERRNFELVSEYLKTLIEDAQIAKASVDRYDAYLRHLLYWAWDIPFTQAATIRPSLLAYLEQTPSKPSGTLAPQSRKKIVGCARKFFEWVKTNHPTEFKAVPLAWIEKLKFLKKQANQAKNKLEFVELNEAIMLATTPGAEGDLAHWRGRAMAARLFLTGERANAAVTSPISAIDFDKGTLKQWPELGVKTKNGKSATTFLLGTPELIEVARSWDEYVRKNLPPTAVWYAPIDSQWGEQKLSEQKPGKNRSVGLNKRLRILFAKAGLPYKSAHKFRHGHASWGLVHCEGIADYKALSLNLMHESLEITDSTYAHLLEEDVHTRIGNLSKQPVDQPDGKIEQFLASISKSERQQTAILLTQYMG